MRTRTNQELQALDEKQTIIRFYKLQRLEIGGHLIRMDSARAVKTTSDCTPLQKILGGRPRKRWQDCVEDLKTKGKKRARKREAMN